LLICFSDILDFLGNSTFHFKQFSIKQEQSAMKVCTDSCLFGAYVNPVFSEHIIDIGCGTGLLSLMLAQRYDARITAIELDKEASLEAEYNIHKSPWMDRIRLIQGDIRQNHILNYTGKTDTLICNPPFHEHQLTGKDSRRNTAHHTNTLSFEELAKVSCSLLTDQGQAYFLIPAYASVRFKNIFEANQLFISRQCLITNFLHTNPFRIILELRRSKQDIITDHLTIYDVPGTYSRRTLELLEPYYLYL
jgi:tRNA1Val (adenine37-N6)-methyltransferase